MLVSYNNIVCQYFSILIHIVQFAGAVRACSNAMGVRVQCGRRSHQTLQETHGSSHPTISRDDGAEPSNRTQTPSNQLQLELQAKRAEREALTRHVRRLEDEFHHVKGLMATVLESSPNIQQNQTLPSQNQPLPLQSQLPIQTPIMDLPSSSSKAVKRGKAAKKKAKVAMVDWQAHHQSGTIQGRQLQLWWIW